MKRFKKYFSYIFIFLTLASIAYWAIIQGQGLEFGKKMSIPHTGESPWGEFLNSLSHNFENPFSTLLAQIIVILVVSRIFGWFTKKIGQPTVIGEIIAGIVLGPSLVGHLFPEFSHFLFPQHSLGNLQLVSQFGLILFMFIVGMELDLKVLRNRANDAFVISQISIIVPFTLGMFLAFFIYETYAPDNIQFVPFSLFIGIAMSITAFPVLARIVRERGIHNTRLGAIVITCAAVDDITGWCLLAAVIAIAKAGSFVSSIYILLMALLYVVFMFKVVRPFLKRIGDLHSSHENLTKPIVAIFFFVLILSAYATELIGIHALFGAFIAGVIMPDNMKFRTLFIEKLEDVSLVLLLPLFFVFTGLRTEIGLLSDVATWKIAGIVILVAITGKFAGSAMAARMVKNSWKDSLTIGALMNTRGLMELVVLNIGYDMGIISPKIFAIMVIMALITTFMTGPSLNLINRLFKEKIVVKKPLLAHEGSYNILLSFGNPNRGRTLLQLASALIGKSDANNPVTALHLSPTNDVSQFNIDEYETESFLPIKEESILLNQKISTIFKVSNDIESDIAEFANNGNYDLLLLGAGQSIYEGSLLGKIIGATTKITNPDRIINALSGKERIFEFSPFDDKVRQIISKSTIPVGILIDNKETKFDSFYVPVYTEYEAFIFKYISKLAINSDSKITVHLINPALKTNQIINEEIAELMSNFKGKVDIIENSLPEKNQFFEYGLLVMGIESWKKLLTMHKSQLKRFPSALVIKNCKQEVIVDQQ
jgi:Kef-type K+ transport system membrane component KefB